MSENINLRAIRADLEAFLSTNEISQAALARALGLSSGAISIFRKGEYKGNNYELGKKIKLYIENYAKKPRISKDSVLFESSDKKMSEFVITEAANEKEIAIITGVAGSGKSTIAQNYTKSHPNAILIEATLHTTARVLIDELMESLRLNGGKNLHEKVMLISKELKRRDVMILIDEAEHLSVRALEDLRRIWDFSSCPIILFGTEILSKNLTGKNGELRQLYSRIAGQWNMKGLDKVECESVFGAGIYEYTKGNFRSSSKLFSKAQRLAELHNKAISPAIIDQAVSMIIL